jgi:hypothetical protein
MGMGQELALWTPSTELPIEQEAKRSGLALKWSTSPQEAIKQAKKLVAAWPHARPPDAEGYAASLGAVLAQYPLGVVQECCDPRTGLAKIREFPPTVAAIEEWCSRRLAYHRGMVKWGERAKPEPQFSEAHERGMLKRLQDLMRGLLRQQKQAEATQ